MNVTELLTAASVRALADELGLRPTKQRGQNFVIDPNTVRMIVAEAALAPGAPVVEVGPGLGSLTLGLLDAGHPVTAVEIDPLLAERLPDTVARHAGAGAPFTLVNADALHVSALPEVSTVPGGSSGADPAGTHGPPTALVANLPYNVAVPVLLHFLATFESLTSVLVMVQAEVADRLTATPGSKVYGVPSVKAAWYGSATRGSDIGKNVFWPAPNVGSGLVHLVKNESARPADVTRDQVFTIVDAAFAQRRKSLRAALAGWAGGATRSGRILETAGIDPMTRGERLDVDQFIAIARAANATPRQITTETMTTGPSNPAETA